MPCVILACLGLSAGAQARVHAPRVVSPHNADAYSLRTFARFPRWRGLEGDRLAWEIYRYLADPRTGLFHMNEVLEGPPGLSEYRTVRDPIKIINVYGYAYCAILGPVMAGICEGIGLGPSRTLVLPDWKHVACECLYGGRWHYLDIDVRAVFRRSDGTLASMEEARRDPSLWAGPRGPLFFPHDPLDRTRAIYAKTPVHHYHAFHQGGHTMDFVLRQGETFTRWWTPQGGRWHHAASYNRQAWLEALLERPPRGPKPNHRDFSIHDHGNGLFHYAPDLTDRSTDFADGIYDAANVRPGPEGLTLAAPGEGHAIFQIGTPYIIVPEVGDLETTEDDRGASIVRIDGRGARLAISLDRGRTWEDVGMPRVFAPIDLTHRVSGTYGYLLRIALRGRPGEAVVRKLDVTTWVQVAPASLPSLRRGTNRMAFRTGDHYGLPTRAVRIRPDLGDAEGLRGWLVGPRPDHDPARATSRVRGRFTVRVDAPPRARIAWFSAGASFRTHLHEASARTRNAIAYAAGAPRAFGTIYRARVPRDVEHWHYNADREVRLEEPARTVYLRYTGDPAVNAIRVDLHCLEDRPRPASPVRITHVWLEGGARRSKTVTLGRPGPYTITAEADPVDVSIEMAVASRRRERAR